VLAQRAVDGVVGEAVGGGVFEIEPRVPAQQVERVALGAEVEHQARAAEAQLGRCRSGLGTRRLIAGVDLHSHVLAEEVAEPAPAADLVVQIESAVVPGEGPEDSELECMRPLGGERRRSERGECEDSARVHDVTSCDRVGVLLR